MSFLQPLLLFALPICAAPILIHLINQRRFHTIEWGAMQFLLHANRMSQGYSRIRRWLILACRTLAIAALIFVIGRPLASGWLGLAGGNGSDTTIIIVDRSASMQQRNAAAAMSKLDTGLQQLAGTLGLVNSKRWVLIDSATLSPQEIESPEVLPETIAGNVVSASANLPQLLQAAHDYISSNKTGPTEIWILSDLRSNDWGADDGHWRTLRNGFLDFKQDIRFHLLAYPESKQGNLGVRVTNVRRRTIDGTTELLLSLDLTSSEETGMKEVPIRFDIEGATTEHVVQWDGPRLELRDFAIPIDESLEQGWGTVSLPADVYPSDDSFYFVFSKPMPRKTVIVTDDGTASRPLILSAGLSPDVSQSNLVETLPASRIASLTWAEIALVVWQANLPNAKDAALLDAFVDSGGHVLFLPPSSPDRNAYRGVAWTEWQETPSPLAIENWRSDEGLWARTQSGAALPVGQLQIRRYCQFSGEAVRLAWLHDGAILLARAPSAHGGVWFLATSVEPTDSSLARDGVVLYAMIQRALAAGAAERGDAQNVVAGELADEANLAWRELAGGQSALSSEYPYVAGVYAVENRTVAVNRTEAEDQGEVLPLERIDGLFQGLRFDRVSDAAGDSSALAREIWRVFLIMMMIALFVESLLCIPKRATTAGAMK
ncbi:BatA domain-containing protein [Blastopirellula sp. JC732]|uniref:BatA domain-containing protein n=1 Tax=Blastopirellula sediminis TaxID=2894196 RepID=A0A9X1MHN4_9BACT|nr:BatA domain-containing protein [Blastopirellula sediminis]MCC9608063.1 BatA domain-containing protein [Blastopirellula sediminis]MCC9627144.1 BatA domain-containing protein [Blastopirellula sediminis]